ncbi:MAG: ester cyclase [Sporichthyaceae bacterium]
MSEIVERYEQCWVERNSAGMAACFTPGGTYTAPGADRIGGAQIGEFAQAFFAAFPDSRYTWNTVAVQDGVAVVEWVFAGTMTAPLLGIEPTGGVASAHGVHVVRLAADRIGSVAAYWDNQGLFEQLGVKG